MKKKDLPVDLNCGLMHNRMEISLTPLEFLMDSADIVEEIYFHFKIIVAPQRNLRMILTVIGGTLDSEMPRATVF